MLSLRKKNANTLWRMGLALWPIYFVGLVVVIFLQSENLNFLSQLIIVSYNLLMIRYIQVLFRKILKENIDRELSWLKNGFLSVVIIGTAFFIFQNCYPYVIDTDPTIYDSPFSSWYDNVKQTYFGYPFPFFRNLKATSELYGKYIFDAASLSINLVFYSAFIYCLVGINVLFQYIRDESVKPK